VNPPGEGAKKLPSSPNFYILGNNVGLLLLLLLYHPLLLARVPGLSLALSSPVERKSFLLSAFFLSFRTYIQLLTTLDAHKLTPPSEASLPSPELHHKSLHDLFATRESSASDPPPKVRPPSLLPASFFLHVDGLSHPPSCARSPFE
jgi:hypothetical protein